MAKIKAAVIGCGSISPMHLDAISALDQVECAILEKNGKLTVLPKAQYAPPTAEELGMKAPQDELMHIVFYNGNFSNAGLRLVGKNKAWLLRELDRRGLSTAELFCVTANDQGRLFWLHKEKKKK